MFCFAGHTDVVPPGPLEEWRTDPFVPVIEERHAVRSRRRRYEERTCRHADGRARNSCADIRRTCGTIAFLITSDEEGPSVDGTRRVVEVLRERNETIDWCLVGEPSSEKSLGRHDQDRPPGQLERAAHRAWCARSCRLSAARRQSRPRLGAGTCRPDLPHLGSWQSRTFNPRRFKYRTSRPARGPRT